MLHKTLEAKVTTTDLGEFTALAAAYSVDRVKERILPGAFKGTIAAWQGSGKQIPLHWDHSAAAADIIGTVDPASMVETEQGLQVKGKLDLDESETAREAWRSMKKNRVGLSFGYLVTDDAKGTDGIRDLKAVDLFEVTITPAPANPDTRFIDMKSVSTKEVGNATRGHIENLIKYYMSKPHPFTSCVRDNTKRFGPDRAKRICATLKDMGTGTTHWREGSSLKGRDWVQELYDASEGDLEGLLEMWHAHREANGDKGLKVCEACDEQVVKKVDESWEDWDRKRFCSEECETKLARIEDARDEEPETAKSEAQDPLRRSYDELALELSTRGIDVAEPPKVEEKPTIDDPLTLEEHRRRAYDLMLETL